MLFRICCVMLALLSLGGCDDSHNQVKEKEPVRKTANVISPTASAQNSSDIQLRGLSVESKNSNSYELRDVSQIKPIELFARGMQKNVIKYFAVSEDGTMLASSSGNNEIYLWSISQRQVIYEVSASGDVKSLAINMATKRLCAMTKSYDINIFDLVTGKLLQKISCADLGRQSSFEDIWSVKLSQDGKYLAGLVRHQVVLWKMNPVEVVGTLGIPDPLKKYTHYFSSIEFSPDGKHLFGGASMFEQGPASGYPIIMWDVSKAVPIRSFLGEKREIKNVVIDPSGEVVYGNLFKNSPGWEIKTGNIVETSFAFNRDILEKNFLIKGYASAYSYNAKINSIFVYSDDKLYVVDLGTKSASLFQPQNLEKLNIGHALGSAGEFAGFVVNGNAYLVDLRTGQVVHNWRGAPGQMQTGEEAISKILIGPHCKYVGLARGDYRPKNIYVYNEKAWDVPIATIAGAFESFTLGIDGTTLYVTYHNNMKLWNKERKIDTVLQHIALPGHGKPCAVMKSDGTKIYFFSAADSVQVYDVNSDKISDLLSTYQVQTIGLDASEEYLYAGVGESVYVWRTGDNSLLNKIDVGSTVTSVAINADEQLAYIATRGKTTSLQSFDLKTGKLFDTFRFSGAAPSAISFNLRTNILYVDINDSVIAIDADGLNVIATMKAFSDAFVVTTKSGFYSGANDFRKYLFMKNAAHAYVPLKNGENERFDPGQVALVLTGGDIPAATQALRNYRTLPPTILSVSEPSYRHPVYAPSIPIRVTLGDSGGGFGNVVVQVTNETANPQTARYEFPGQGSKRSFEVPLSKGVNDVLVFANNQANSKASSPCKMQLYCKY